MGRHGLGGADHDLTLLREDRVAVDAPQVDERVMTLGPIELPDVHGQPTGVAEQLHTVRDQSATALEVVWTALPNVPAEFLDRFLQRHPTHRALRATADRWLAR